MKSTPYILVLVIILSSCISKEEHNALKKDLESLRSLNEESIHELKLNTDSLSLELKTVTEEKNAIDNQLGVAAGQIKSVEEQYLGLIETNKVLENNYKGLLSSSSNRNQKLFQQLGEKQKHLEEKEDTLNLRLQSIRMLEEQLAIREARVKELEGIIEKQDSAAQALKQRIKDALYKFNDEQVSVVVKNGKVYVSLSNEILFKSGSIEVDSVGVVAMGLLASVLNSNNDIEVNIEGHTDTDKGVDNWDLSVKRATSIVRILTAAPNSVDPARVTASGRGEFQPIGDNESTEGKAKNRRIEVILTPNLDEIYNFLDGEL